MVDGFFFLDLICQFFTAYVDKKGKEIKKFSMISKNYILSFRFIVDTVSLIGVAQKGAIQNTAMLKTTRVGRVGIFI